MHRPRFRHAVFQAFSISKKGFAVPPHFIGYPRSLKQSALKHNGMLIAFFSLMNCSEHPWKNRGYMGLFQQEKENPSTGTAPGNLDDLETLCRKARIDFKGFETMICCHQPMTRGFGPLGMDYVCCLSCGKLLANMASPRVNGGIAYGPGFINRNGQKTWALAGMWQPITN
jgi:hypothetical protein